MLKLKHVRVLEIEHSVTISPRPAIAPKLVQKAVPRRTKRPDRKARRSVPERQYPHDAHIL